MRQIRLRFDRQPINETDTPWLLEMEDEDMIDVLQQRQELSNKKGTCLLLQSTLEIRKSELLQYCFIYSVISCPHVFIVHKELVWIHKHIVIFFFF